MGALSDLCTAMGDLGMFCGYKKKPTIVYALKWEGKEIPEDLKDNERVILVMKKGEICIELRGSKSSPNKVIKPGDFLHGCYDPFCF